MPGTVIEYLAELMDKADVFVIQEGRKFSVLSQVQDQKKVANFFIDQLKNYKKAIAPADDGE